MKKIIISAAILCMVLYIGLGNQSGEEAESTPVPSSTPPQMEATAAPAPEMEVPKLKAEEPIVKAVSPTPLPTPVSTPVLTETPKPTPIPIPASIPAQAPATPQPVQAGDMVYVEGFGWLKSQGEGTVIYDEMMYENGNKVGSMG